MNRSLTTYTIKKNERQIGEQKDIDRYLGVKDIDTWNEERAIRESSLRDNETIIIHFLSSRLSYLVFVHIIHFLPNTFFLVFETCIIYIAFLSSI